MPASTKPGITTDALTPERRYVARNDDVNATSAAFVAAYDSSNAGPDFPAREEMLTMWPRFRSSYFLSEPGRGVHQTVTRREQIGS